MYVYFVIDESIDPTRMVLPLNHATEWYDKTSSAYYSLSTYSEKEKGHKTIYEYNNGSDFGPTWMQLVKDLIEVLESHYGYSFDLNRLKEKEK